jgi:BTB And C-terminal Kelch
MFSTLRVVLGSDDIVDCDEALLFEATARWLEHYPADVGNQQDVCLSLLRLVRFPIMDSCLLSDVIKGHPLMVGAERTNLLLEAFEHHALRYGTPNFL